MNDAQVSFGVTHFSGLELGDARLSRRLPVLVNQLLEHATGTIPEKFSRPADREAFYRLCNAEGVTHASVLTTHFSNTLQLLQQATTYRLVIHDATNLDYSNHKSLKSLGQIGNGGGRGYLVHNSLVVDPKNRNVLGLASQMLHTRITHDGIYKRLASNSGVARILCGDFNSPQLETRGGRVITWGEHEVEGQFVCRGRYRGRTGKEWDMGERSVLQGLAEFDLHDVFRGLHGFGVEAFSWYLRRQGKTIGRRFDHIFASRRFSVRGCDYLHALREAKLSDHSPIEADLDGPR
jgi:endonuclease/exonuclease/phosphatase family metal-dependent hydrolase